MQFCSCVICGEFYVYSGTLSPDNTPTLKVIASQSWLKSVGIISCKIGVSHKIIFIAIFLGILAGILLDTGNTLQILSRTMMNLSFDAIHLCNFIQKQ